MSVANLRDIARSYKNLHSLGNISKQTKATLTETLSKVMEWKEEELYTKKEHGGTKVATYAKYDGEIHDTHDKKSQPKKAEDKKEAQPKKAEKSSMFDKDAKKKSVKKAISQAKSAGDDAKAIAPPKMEEEPAVKAPQKEVSEKNMIYNIERSHSTKLRKRITQISEDIGVKIPRGVLTKNMYSEDLRTGTNTQFGTSNKGQNAGREDLSNSKMLKVALSHIGDKRKEFLTKLFSLIFVKN